MSARQMNPATPASSNSLPRLIAWTAVIGSTLPEIIWQESGHQVGCWFTTIESLVIVAAALLAIWIPSLRALVRFLVAVGLVAFLFQWAYRWQRERRYDPLILAASQRYGVDPALVKAVIWRESRFKAGARGRVGEIGLMQIREPAAYEWAAAENKPNFSPR